MISSNQVKSIDYTARNVKSIQKLDKVTFMGSEKQDCFIIRAITLLEDRFRQSKSPDKAAKSRLNKFKLSI